MGTGAEEVAIGFDTVNAALPDGAAPFDVARSGPIAVPHDRRRVLVLSWFQFTSAAADTFMSLVGRKFGGGIGIADVGEVNSEQLYAAGGQTEGRIFMGVDTLDREAKLSYGGRGQKGGADPAGGTFLQGASLAIVF